MARGKAKMTPVGPDIKGYGRKGMRFVGCSLRINCAASIGRRIILPACISTDRVYTRKGFVVVLLRQALSRHGSGKNLDIYWVRPRIWPWQLQMGISRSLRRDALPT